MKQFCVNGHDTTIVGRRPSNRECRQCYRDLDRARFGRRTEDPAYRMRRATTQMVRRVKARIPIKRQRVADLERELALLLAEDN